MEIIVNNKKAYHDYTIEDKYEAGIVLEGWEVKSVKNHKISLSSAFIKDIDNQLYLTGSKITSWQFTKDQERNQTEKDRKLLLNRNEIAQIQSKVKEKGYTVVPLEVYINTKGYVKVTVALAKGKKKFDKREVLKRKDQIKRIDQERRQTKY